MLYIFLSLGILWLHSLAVEMLMYSLTGMYTWSRGAEDSGLI